MPGTEGWPSSSGSSLPAVDPSGGPAGGRAAAAATSPRPGSGPAPAPLRGQGHPLALRPTHPLTLKKGKAGGAGVKAEEAVDTGEGVGVYEVLARLAAAWLVVHTTLRCKPNCSVCSIGVRIAWPSALKRELKACFHRCPAPTLVALILSACMSSSNKLQVQRPRPRHCSSQAPQAMMLSRWSHLLELHLLLISSLLMPQWLRQEASRAREQRRQSHLWQLRRSSRHLPTLPTWGG